MTDKDYDIEEPTATMPVEEDDIDMGKEPVDAKDIDVSPENVVDVVQRKRMEILMNGAPIDKDELSLMNDLTRTSQTQQRIEVDNKAADSDKEIAKSLAQMVVSGVSLAKPENEEKDITPKELPQLDDSQAEDFKVDDALVTTEQDNISLEEVMAAEDLKSDT